jgi:hypothetical protein
MPPDIAKISVIHTVSNIKMVNLRTYEVEAILAPLDLMFITLRAVRVHSMPMPVAARSKARFCGNLLAGIASSNHARGMDVYLL